MSTHAKSRGWTVTWNNPTLTGEVIHGIWKSSSTCPTYYVFQMERGTTMHLQGYVHYTNPLTLASVKKRLNLEGVHLEMAKGSAQQNKTYCTKQDETYVSGPWEHGDLPAQGTRTDLSAAIDWIKENKKTPVGTLALTEFAPTWVKYHKALDALHSTHQSTMLRDRPVVIFIVGPPGRGKSTWCLENFKDAFWMNNGKWWDGYAGQEVVILDDFDATVAGQLTWRNFKLLLDRFPLQLEKKGNMVNILAKIFIVTSNYAQEKWFKCLALENTDPVDRQALARRVTRNCNLFGLTSDQSNEELLKLSKDYGNKDWAPPDIEEGNGNPTTSPIVTTSHAPHASIDITGTDVDEAGNGFIVAQLSDEYENSDDEQWARDRLATLKKRKHNTHTGVPLYD